MIFNFIQKAKEVLYKNGKSVEAALDEVNENLDKYKLKTYTTLSQIGMTVDNSCEEVMDVLPANSMLILSLSSDASAGINASLPVKTRCLLTLIKSGSADRGEVRQELYDSNLTYVCSYLDGKLGNWERYVLISDLDGLKSGMYLNKNTDLNTVTCDGYCTQSDVIATFKNLPSGITRGEISVRWLSTGSFDNDGYGLQILNHAEDGVNITYQRYKNGGTWGEWDTYVSKSLLAPKSITDNITFGSCFANGGMVYGYKSGNVVTISFKLNATDDVSTTSARIMGNLPVPLSTMYGIGCVTGAERKLTEFVVTPSSDGKEGVIDFLGKSNVSYQDGVSGQITYMTNS